MCPLYAVTDLFGRIVVNPYLNVSTLSSMSSSNVLVMFRAWALEPWSRAKPSPEPSTDRLVGPRLGLQYFQAMSHGSALSAQASSLGLCGWKLYPKENWLKCRYWYSSTFLAILCKKCCIYYLMFNSIKILSSKPFTSKQSISIVEVLSIIELGSLGQ